MKNAAVTVAVPVFNGCQWLEKTVAAIQQQSWENLKIILGVDVSSDKSSELAKRLASRNRNIKCIIHDERKGFLKNLNSLLACVDTDYFCFLPQDDVIHADYIKTLIECLHANPSAVLAYCDLTRDDMLGSVRYQASLIGDRNSRLIQFLAMQMNAVEWRGVVRVNAISKPIVFFEGNVVDHLYPLHLAEWGDLIRVPEVLYTKRMHSRSATAPYRQTDHGRRFRILHALVSCFDCYRHVVAKLDSEEIATLWKIALVARLLRLLEAEWPISSMGIVSDDDLALFGSLLDRRSDWIVQLYELIGRVPKFDLVGQHMTAMLTSLSYFYLATLGKSLNMQAVARELALKSIAEYPEIKDYDHFFRGRFRQILKASE